ncbi:hypothetical protein LPB86_19760 [Pedobacter sp. MC2016-14]|uniref:PKD-like family lipoprotein n=1 Tax=Pedobacter sp. MC2016-14 TaxID=2897327 RepID=UPI001E3ED1A5|nr:PKD-like family lipoprotein [Pedobacter sp. MC2016-14]MCD0490485.1 hypothetical protein [Pedobacter sp. MC2016-14]
MKSKSIIFYICIVLFACSCKKDLGNYTYSPPSVPMLQDFTDNTFNAVIGDSLILRPNVSLEGADPLKDLSFEWAIQVAEEARTQRYSGYPLKVVYNLPPGLRNGTLTVNDKRNGMRYLFNFKLLGTTPFSIGRTVLSVDNGITKLSFIKPDGRTVQSDLYSILNHETLPANPIQLFAKPRPYQAGTVEDYWVICQDNATGGVIIDGGTMLKKKNFSAQFLVTPSTLVPNSFEAPAGMPIGVINNKLYTSVFETAPFAPDFGKFTAPKPGDYQLSKYFGYLFTCYFGFDTKAGAFVSFNGGAAYNGTDYVVTREATDPPSPFNPKAVGMTDLLFMKPVLGTTYAFFRNSAGTVTELSFIINMGNYDNRAIKPISTRIFKGSANVMADTKWQRSLTDVYYFTSNDKIYRYNPINEELTQLSANFAGKKVTMIKLSDDGNTLTAGVDGNIMVLNTAAGANGNIIQTVTGIPGAPIDIVNKVN